MCVNSKKKLFFFFYGERAAHTSHFKKIVYKKRSTPSKNNLNYYDESLAHVLANLSIMLL